MCYSPSIPNFDIHYIDQVSIALLIWYSSKLFRNTRTKTILFGIEIDSGLNLTYKNDPIRFNRNNEWALYIPHALSRTIIPRKKDKTANKRRKILLPVSSVQVRPTNSFTNLLGKSPPHPWQVLLRRDQPSQSQLDRQPGRECACACVYIPDHPRRLLKPNHLVLLRGSAALI